MVHIQGLILVLYTHYRPMTTKVFQNMNIIPYFFLFKTLKSKSSLEKKFDVVNFYFLMLLSMPSRVKCSTVYTKVSNFVFKWMMNCLLAAYMTIFNPVSWTWLW